MIRSVLQVAAVGILLAMPAGSEGLFLHVLPTSAPDGLPAAGPGAWPVVLTFNDLEAALEVLPRVLAPARLAPADSAPETSGRVSVQVQKDQVLGGEVRAEHRKASFVIDFHEPEVVELTEALLDSLDGPQLTGRPSVHSLIRFGHQSIGTKNMSRGWDLASRVARHGEGDCTEHAVLLVALARSLGYPARLVQGLALIVPSSAVEPEARDLEAAAYGHAWAEIHDGERWRSADATLLGEEKGVTVRLLPLMSLDNEGPGYGMAAAAMIQLLPRSVEIGRAAPERREAVD